MPPASPRAEITDRLALVGLLRQATKVRMSDVPAIARALAWSTFARVLMMIGGFNAAARVLRYESVKPVDLEPGPYPVLDRPTARALRVTRKVLERKTLHVTCLPRSIAMERTLRAHGLAADVVIGVMREQGLKAHAWVEVNGYPVSEMGRNQWPALARFRSRG